MKDLKRSHFIQRFKFDFEIERSDDANRMHNALSRLFNEKIEKLLDRILSELDDPAFVTKFPKIEIDLGEIHENSLESEVMQRFEQKFRREMSLRMAEIKHPTAIVPADRGERVAMVPAQIDMLMHFLVQGRLPIGAENMAGKVEELFWNLIEQQPASVLASLKALLPTKPAALSRLATAFSSKLVERIYALALRQNARSIISYEQETASAIAKATDRALTFVEVELRMVLLRYLILDKPDSFQMSALQTVVEREMGRIYGPEAAKATQQKGKGKTKAQTLDQRKRDLEDGKVTEAALDLIATLIAGKADRESNVAIIEAWEFLVATNPVALQRLLAAKAAKPAALDRIVEIIPVQSLRDFMQRISKTIGLRLIQLAATVVSAHDAMNPTTAQRNIVSQAVYAALLHQIASDPTASPTPQRTEEAIKTHLQSISEPPKELLERWEKYDFVAQEPSKRPTSKDAKLTQEEREELQKQAAEELAKLAEEERTKPPQTREEILRSRERMEEIRKRQAEWQLEQNEILAREMRGEMETSEEEMESDEAFYKRGREWELSNMAGQQILEQLGDVMQDIDGSQLFLAPNLGTGLGRAELVMHYLATGTAPWWAARFVPMQVEIMLKSVISREPEAIQAAFVRVAKSLPTDRYTLFVERIIHLLQEDTFMQLLPMLAGDLGGFTVTIGLALEEAMNMLPEGIAAPSTPRERRQFAYQHQLRYLMEYASSATSPAQMVRYVLKQVQQTVGLSPRRTIEWMMSVVEVIESRGERRFMAVKSMIPKVFEGIEVSPATPHEIGVDTLAFQRTLLEKQSLIPAEETEDEVEGSSDEKTGRETSPLSADTAQPTPQDQPITPDQPQGQDQPLRPDQQRNLENPDEPVLDAETPENQVVSRVTGLPQDPSIKPGLETADPEYQRVEAQGKEGDLEPGKEPVTPIDGKVETQPGQGDDEVDPKADRLTPEGETTSKTTDPKTADPDAAKPPTSLYEKLQAALKGPEVVPQIEIEPMDLDPEEVEKYGIDGEWVISVIRNYLLHGSLAPAATAIYTADSFKEEIKLMLASGARPVIQMLREIIGNRDVRLRIFGLGDEIALKAISLLNMAAADRMLPYVREVIELFKGTSSPVAVGYLYEHAVQHALGLRTTFLPITYMKQLFEFLAMQPNVNVREALIFANRRLETSSSPLKSSLDEMLDVVDRIEQLRDDRRQNGIPDDRKRSAPTYVASAMDEEIYVSNAGVGIIYLFTITLFKAFNMITEDRKEFVSKQAQVRAIHQIQYLCYKEIDSPEEKMVLAKLMVGWPIDEPLEPLETPLNEDDIDTCEAILGMVCTQWGVMKNAGNEYLRKTFLQREGRLKQEGSDWLLKVEQNGIDILKNKIPWATNPVRLPWLSYLIEIEWP